MREEARLVPRVRGVLRLEPSTYAEVDADPGSIPQAFIVVIASAMIAGLSGSFYLLFMSIAGLLFAWLVAAALIWAVATLVVGHEVDYARIVRCLGFAYVWVVPLALAQLPLLIGELISGTAIALLFYSFWLATKQVIGEHAFKVCAIALILPLVLLLIASRLD